MKNTKSELRKLYKEKRKNIEEIELAQRSQQISTLFFNGFNLEKINSIHIFLPILKQKEPNTWLIINTLWESYPHIQVITSKSDFETHEMQSVILSPESSLKENTWGIPEITDALSYPDKNIDLILIPLLAFDTKGYRVGYGKGFYDRFLEKCKPDIIKVGLSLEPPIEQITDINIHDIPMDYAITPAFLFTFNKETSTLRK